MNKVRKFKQNNNYTPSNNYNIEYCNDDSSTWLFMQKFIRNTIQLNRR